MKPRFSLVAILFFGCVGLTVAGEVHVAPTGDDANPGTATKPVATLAKAVELSRNTPAGEPKRIAIAAGVYFDTGACLTAEDSGLTIESAGDKQAMLIGGVPLAGWQKQDERFWSAQLPAGRDWDVRMLLVNGRFCQRARFPETGAFEHLSVFDSKWRGTHFGGWSRKPTPDEEVTLKYKKEDIPDDLDLGSAEITVFHMWDDSVGRAAQQDKEKCEFRLSPTPTFPPGAFGIQKYCIWNTKEGMTKPGQWYFDRSAGRIVYWPLEGEDMTKADVIVPTQRSIIRLTGAEDVTIRNLRMAVTTVPLLIGQFSAMAFDGAVQLDGCKNVKIANLKVDNVAGQAVKAWNKQDGILVENCEIGTCGAGGIYLDGDGNLMRNNLVHDIGVMFAAAVGIQERGTNGRMSHNVVRDTTYSAVYVRGDGFTVDHNLMQRCMTVLHDGAAIYVMGNRNVLTNNVARDITDTGGFGTSSYYIDELSEHCVVENNISINVVMPSKGHIAKNNTIRNNVFINQGDIKLVFHRCSDYTLAGNVIYAGGKITFEGINAVSDWSGNLLYSGKDEIEGITVKEYEHIGTVPGVVGDTVVGDPMFVDLDKLDLQYKPGSPALKLGLEPLSVSQAGRE